MGTLHTLNTRPRRPFLTAEWRRLGLVTFAVPGELVARHLPPGLEPDRWEGNALASLVAFEFQNVCVLGVPALGFRSFPEWNLRLYAREEGAEKRRGVVFVREFVPSTVVAGVARLLYNEPYTAVRYRATAKDEEGTIAVEHVIAWPGPRRFRFAFVAGGEPTVQEEGSLAHFLKEQQWGFGKTRKGNRTTYRVEHPTWRTYEDARFDLDLDAGTLYGDAWAFLNHATPISKFAIEGSAIRVFPSAIEPPESRGEKSRPNPDEPDVAAAAAGESPRSGP